MTEPSGDPIRFSVVIPFYDEEDNVIELLGEVAAAMALEGSYEIIAVDDCSRDRTKARLLALKSDNPWPLRVLTHGGNKGQSAAICTGIDAARGDWIVTLDGDGQNDPADIRTLLEIVRDADPARVPVLICGHRRQRQDTWLRRLSSRVANGVRARLLGDATPDTGCGLKVLERAAFLTLPRFDHMHRFLPALVRRSGGDIISVPVSHRPRLHGRSKYGVWNRLWVGIVDLCGVIWLKRRALNVAISEE